MSQDTWLLCSLIYNMGMFFFCFGMAIFITLDVRLEKDKKLFTLLCDFLIIIFMVVCGIFHQWMAQRTLFDSDNLYKEKHPPIVMPVENENYV
jgi:hypothetical protein